MKDKNIAALLAFFLGGLGAHKFYLNKPAIGIIYLLFFWTFIPAILGFFEAISFISYSKLDWDNLHNKPQAASEANEVKSQQTTSAIENLNSLAKLLESGILTKDEFELKKAELLKKI